MKNESTNNSKAISSCDFQPVPFQKARPASSSSNTTTGDKDKDKDKDKDGRQKEQAERETMRESFYALISSLRRVASLSLSHLPFVLTTKLTGCLPHAQHSIRCKAYASHYTPFNLAKLTLEMGDATGKIGIIIGPTLHGLPPHTPLDSSDTCFALDIIVSSSYGFSLGAIRKWALEAGEALTVAIGRDAAFCAVPTWA
ncbi:hypothetical protein B0H16DRAFT_1903337 [Mycena metata]|uniref:Uncharacterized protein n=1 Tax=Mycena metata TaxID=1033252 RepID=A0AAD7GK43_9AGAR|nr:hypothetical protein B0H16DRAFT_1903337 [Mycena metata]